VPGTDGLVCPFQPLPHGRPAAVESFKTYGIRSVFATGHSDAEIRKRAEVARPLAWLQKPYSMSSLVRQI
jgi:hypothetical protein